jgi:acetyltransferase-like isoleucine patch superfamily enzyme
MLTSVDAEAVRKDVGLAAAFDHCGRARAPRVAHHGAKALEARTHASASVRFGAHYYNPAQASPWVMSFYLQALYGAFPQLERNLIVLGLFSPWLRLWGSKVGTNVLWTSHTQILDRSGLEIGDNVFFGHMCLLTPHVTDLRHGKLLFYFRKIHIGHNVFLGGACRIGPGVRIDDGVALPAATDIFIGKHITKDTYKKTSRGAQ